jgi:COP9 signalosome complex subunit 4
MRAFELTLMDHQKAMTSDGFSLSQKAVIEHNLFAARRIYDNILFRELAHLVGLDLKLTESVSLQSLFTPDSPSNNNQSIC